MRNKRPRALLIFAAFITALLAGVISPNRSLAWICGGILAALILSFLDVLSKSETKSSRLKTIRSRKEGFFSSFLSDFWPWHILLLSVILIIISGSIQITEDENLPFYSILSESLKSLGYSLVIAVILAATIDRRARRAEQEMHVAMRRDIAKDVFHGVFETNLPKSYVNAVISQNLNVNIIRHNLQIIEDHNPLYLEHGLVLQCNRTVKFEIESVSTRDIIENLRYYFPILDNNLRDRVKIHQLIVDGQVFRHSDIDDSRSVDLERGAVLYQWPIVLHPGQKIRIQFKSTHFKNLTDVETWATLYPTIGFELIVRSRLPLRILAINPRTAHKELHGQSTPEEGVGAWRIDGPILPNESVSYWWSHDENYGKDEFNN